MACNSVEKRRSAQRKEAIRFVFASSNPKYREVGDILQAMCKNLKRLPNFVANPYCHSREDSVVPNAWSLLRQVDEKAVGLFGEYWHYYLFNENLTQMLVDKAVNIYLSDLPIPIITTRKQGESEEDFEERNKQTLDDHLSYLFKKQRDAYTVYVDLIKSFGYDPSSALHAVLENNEMYGVVKNLVANGSTVVRR